ncbi:RTA1-like protein [Mycena sanguinolenta]|uniref:RTA1-like protein n=1 Tax=Mycena sanguinolenta TaxID=230812 RepID=A0A8H6ZEB5_9AGAR|nr:RTA1-like protein [Mycena sanguinolenta]
MLDLEFMTAKPPTQTAPLRSPYHYTPTRWVCLTFLSLFGISTVAHVGQVLLYRAWYLLPTAALCGILEIVGWVSRLSSSKDPHVLLPYEIQMTATIIAPTPLLAANFLTLGKVVERLGSRYCRIAPKTYSIIFLGCDLIALAVQGTGGAIASIAVGKSKDPDNGGHIMLGGIIFQLVAIIAYSFLATEFIVRYITENAFSGGDDASARGELTLRLKVLLSALGVNTFCLVVRAIYRTVELINGFSGSVISTQWYFNIFDGAMVALAIFIVNFAHPGMLLRQNAKKSDKKVEDTGSEVRLQLIGPDERH